MIKISISASRTYDVILEPGALGSAGTYLRAALGMSADPAEGPQHKKLCIVTDANVNPLYGKQEQALWTSLEAAGFSLYRYVFPGGETAKRMETVEGILDYLAENRFTRSDLLLALGGGITGDVTGFAAAVFLRGIEYVQIPTTLLAIVDSSVGGKTGVNLSAGKNLAGSFWQPALVLFDPTVLSTLPRHVLLDGIAEAIKAGVIADASIISTIRRETNPEDPAFLMDLAASAIQVKRKVVEEDERDHGSRQLLNFGHTLAHAIETCSNYEISHGHAVAMGMAIVSTAADRLHWSTQRCAQDIIHILQQFRFPLQCPFSPQELTAAALQDKKIRGENITLVFPAAIGDCRLQTIPVDELEPFITCGMSDQKGFCQ